MKQVEKPHVIGRKSVLIALLGNFITGTFKFVAFFFSGSSVMLSEGIHSIADTTNQIFLLIGITRAEKPANEHYNYGYRSERFFWSLLSACGVFFIGAGATLFHGFSVLTSHETVNISVWTFVALILSFILEGYALRTAFKELKYMAGKEKFLNYVKDSGDPTLLAILYEDSAAIIGIAIALITIVLRELTGAFYWDAVGSLLIGVLLGVVALALMNANRQLLIGRAIPKHIRKKIFTILLNQKVVDEVHDFKTVMIATDGYRVKAEVEINGHYLAQKILSSRDFHEEYEDIKDYHDFTKFCSQFSDEVTRTLGKEIDLLEQEIETEVPVVKHIDIEAN